MLWAFDQWCLYIYISFDSSIRSMKASKCYNAQFTLRLICSELINASVKHFSASFRRIKICNTIRNEVESTDNNETFNMINKGTLLKKKEKNSHDHNCATCDMAPTNSSKKTNNAKVVKSNQTRTQVVHLKLKGISQVASQHFWYTRTCPTIGV